MMVFLFLVGYFRKVLRKTYLILFIMNILIIIITLVTHLTKLGFDVVELKSVKSQGGSIRILLKKTGKGKIYKKAYSFYYLKKILFI